MVWTKEVSEEGRRSGHLTHASKTHTSVLFADLGYAELSDSLDYIFLIFPGHCLGMAFSNLYYNFELKKLCNAKNLSDIDCNDVCKYYKWNLLVTVLFFFISCV